MYGTFYIEKIYTLFYFLKVQALNEPDFPARLNFANWMRHKKNENPDFFSHILFCDESTFTKDGIFNTHNSHYYSHVGNNPHVVKQKKHQDKFSINVWIAVLGNYLLGPVELPDRLNGEHYLNLLQNIVPELLEDVDLNTLRNLWFLHDGCPAHYNRIVLEFLNNNYRDQWIGRGGPVAWPARSPDLNPCDFCIWGHLKSEVYSQPIETRNQLWNRIVNASNEFRQREGIFERIRQSLDRRINLCIETNGHHVENLL